MGGNAETRRQLGRFLVIGGSSVAVDLAAYALLTLAGLPPSISKGVSYASGMVVGFFGNKLWTFGSARRSLHEPFTYALLYAATFVVNVACNSGALRLSEVAAMDRAPSLALAFFAATGVTTVLNFIGMRFVTFRQGIREREQGVRLAEAKLGK